MYIRCPKNISTPTKPRRIGFSKNIKIFNDIKVNPLEKILEEIGK